MNVEDLTRRVAKECWFTGMVKRYLSDSVIGTGTKKKTNKKTKGRGGGGVTRERRKRGRTVHVAAAARILTPVFAAHFIAS